MDQQIYDNPMTITPIKVPELSAYIEKKKSEVDGFKKEYQVRKLSRKISRICFL